MKTDNTSLNVMPLGLTDLELQRLEELFLFSNWRKHSYRVRPYLPYQEVDVILINAENDELRSRLVEVFYDNSADGTGHTPGCIAICNELDEGIRIVNSDWSVYKGAITRETLKTNSEFLDSLDAALFSDLDAVMKQAVFEVQHSIAS